MARGPSQKQITSHIRYRLQKLAREVGGEYVRGTKTHYAKVLVGRIELGYSELRASNGECCLLPYAYDPASGRRAKRLAKFSDLLDEVQAA